MLKRMGISSGGGAPDPAEIQRRALELRVFDDLDLGLEMLVQRMINILLIEISAFHTFVWAETVLSDTDLVAGDGEAARIVSYIRQDESPHVEYLKTALSEIRERTFVGESGRHLAGAEVVGTLWQRGLDESLGVRREQGLATTVRESSTRSGATRACRPARGVPPVGQLVRVPTAPSRRSPRTRSRP